MSIGILERVLSRRYGSPTIRKEGTFIARSWNNDQAGLSSVLFVEDGAQLAPANHLRELAPIYGDAVGGLLIGDSLKVAMLVPHRIFGVYHIDELLAQPELRVARQLDPDVQFFMDAANVWYYGEKDGVLYVFDAETSEFDVLGPLEVALDQVLGEWESACSRSTSDHTE